ncbi:MAG: hypothetical protein ABSF45_07100 [Terriglobia bacterium]|jgi:hypothetical protein
MRDALLKKLTGKFEKAPSSEEDVAYALIEIRKLLERDAKQDQFATLMFFCDWVVHSVLNRRGARDQISRLDYRLGNLDLTNLDDIGPDEEIYRFISFEGLFEELGRFSKEVNLHNHWTSNPVSWRECVKFYGEIVRDCALEVKQPGSQPTSITRVVLTTVSTAPIDNDAESFKLEWEFTLRDGRSFKQSVHFRYPSAASGTWMGRPTEIEFGI